MFYVEFIVFAVAMSVVSQVDFLRKRSSRRASDMHQDFSNAAHGESKQVIEPSKRAKEMWRRHLRNKWIPFGAQHKYVRLLEKTSYKQGAINLPGISLQLLLHAKTSIDVLIDQLLLLLEKLNHATSPHLYRYYVALISLSFLTSRACPLHCCSKECL